MKILVFAYHSTSVTTTWLGFMELRKAFANSLELLVQSNWRISSSSLALGAMGKQSGARVQSL